MNNEINKICSITQNREEYICVNEQCQKQNKKQVHCFECLTKLHRKENNNIVNHIDDFKNINTFMNEVNVKKLERITYLNIIIGQLFDFKKEKFQYIEKYQNNPKEFLDQIKTQIEKELDSFIQQLAEQIVILNKLTEYNPQNHSLIFQVYNQTKPPYFVAINDKKKILEEKVNTFIQKMDLDIHQAIIRQQQKLQQMEQQLSKLTKQPSFGSSLLIKSFFVLLLIINGLNPLIFKLDQTERNEKMIEFQRFVQNVQQEIESKMQLLKEEINKSEKIESVQLKQNQTDAPYIQFKNYFNQKLKQYNESIYQIIDEKVSVKVGETQQLIKSVNQTQQKQNAFIFQMEQQMTYVRSDIKAQEKQQNFIQSQILNITENFTNTSMTIQHVKTQLLTLNPEIKEKKKQQFLGQILVDVPISEFDQFTIIYDELLTKPFDRKSVQNIKQVVSQDTMICIGGMKIDIPNTVLVVACDEVSEIFEFTYHWQHARKSKNGEVYWYMAYPIAFGFSPTELIHLTLCDDLDPTDQRRLSYWFENGQEGGRRIGNQTQLINSNEYKMIMFAL